MLVRLCSDAAGVGLKTLVLKVALGTTEQRAFIVIMFLVRKSAVQAEKNYRPYSISSRNRVVRLMRIYQENCSMLDSFKGAGLKRVVRSDVSLTYLNTQRNQFIICLH
jgi:hypothetical protein